MPRASGRFGRPIRRVVFAKCYPRDTRVRCGVRVQCGHRGGCGCLRPERRPNCPRVACWRQPSRQFVDIRRRYRIGSSPALASARYGRQRSGAGSSPRCRCDSECPFAGRATRMSFFHSTHSDVVPVCHVPCAAIQHAAASRHEIESVCPGWSCRRRIHLSPPKVTIRRRPAR